MEALKTERVKHNGKTEVKITFFRGKYTAQTLTSSEKFDTVEEARKYAAWYIENIAKMTI